MTITIEPTTVRPEDILGALRFLIDDIDTKIKVFYKRQEWHVGFDFGPNHLAAPQVHDYLVFSEKETGEGYSRELSVSEDMMAKEALPLLRKSIQTFVNEVNARQNNNTIFYTHNN